MAYEGSTVTISCFTDSKPTWYKDYVPIDLSLYRVNFIILRDISDKDSGKYVCEGSNDEGLFRSISTLFIGGILFKFTLQKLEFPICQNVTNGTLRRIVCFLTNFLCNSALPC